MHLVNKQELDSYRNQFEQELFSILNYWITYAPESDRDGFHGAVDLENRPVLDAPKSCVLTARILWTFAAAACRYDQPAYREMADRAFRALQNYFRDQRFGGYFMELHADHTVSIDIKHTYAQAFVLYALSKYHEFLPDEALLEQIADYFIFLDGQTKDPDHTGYIEAFTADWEIYGENRMADGDEPKSMNTHLHVLEAYAAVYKVWPNGLVELRLRELIDLFLNKIIREDGHLGIFFDDDFVETDSSKGICSFGHDIEASWLILEAIEILGDEDLEQRAIPKLLQMANAVFREGMDQDGGLFLESTRFGSHLRTNKHWWLQAELLVGEINAFELSGEEKYWNWLKKSWAFIDTFVVDHEGGEWFTKLNRLGQAYRSEPADDPSPYYRNDWKIDPWKCPYHNGRAMMELTSRIEKLKNS